MMKGLTRARSVSILNLMLLVVATALLSHAASTTNWKRLLGAKDDDFSGVWADFCRALEKAGDSVEFYAPNDDDLDRAEGYRYLTRMLRLGLGVELEHSDPDRPVIWESETPTQKFGGNNPDELYYEAVIDGRSTYRVRGSRGTTPLIELTVYDGRIGSDSRSAYVDHLTEAELTVAEDGSFEVVLSPEPHPGNWIRTTPEARILFIRQYRFDWSTDEPARMQIAREGPALPPPPPLSMAELERKLQRTAGFVAGNAELWPRYSAMALAIKKNAFMPAMVEEDESRTGDTQMPQGHTLQPGAFEIAPDEALVIEFTPPAELSYWGFSLLNRWYESLDYRYASVHTNQLRATANADGRVRLVVAHRDPGAANWISTTGHRHGTMLFRWTRPRPDTRYPEIETRLVKLSALEESG